MSLFNLSLPAAFFLVLAAPCGAADTDAAFTSETNAQMSKMMTAMDVKPSGDVDEDFVSMMEPHHQGAIDMAQSELRYGKNEQLRRIAQEIIVEQQQEIVAMRLALGRPLPGSAPAPDQPQNLDRRGPHPPARPESWTRMAGMTPPNP